MQWSVSGTVSQMIAQSCVVSVTGSAWLIIWSDLKEQDDAYVAAIEASCRTKAVESRISCVNKRVYTHLQWSMGGVHGVGCLRRLALIYG